MYAALYVVFIIALWSSAAFVLVYAGVQALNWVYRMLHPTPMGNHRFKAGPVAWVAAALMALLVISTLVYWSNYVK